jgi:lipid A 3-O-deacylase
MTRPVKPPVAALGAALLAWASPAAAEAPGLVALGIGAFDVVRQDEPAADFRLEYRHGQGLWIFQPWLGLEATSDGALYGVIGLFSDFALGRHLVLSPSIGVGAYRRGGGLDLGGVLEFRSQLELAWRFADASRLGVAFSHISNAGIGDHNTGTEIATLYYAFPLAFGAGR